MCKFSFPGSEASGRPATSTLNRFSALQQPPSSSSSTLDSDRRVPQRCGTKSRLGKSRQSVFEIRSPLTLPILLPFPRNSSSRERGDFDRSNRDRFDRRDERRDDRDRNRLQVTKRSFSRENEERSREREQRGSADPVRRVASMTDDRDRGSRERARSKENGRRRDGQKLCETETQISRVFILISFFVVHEQ